MKQNFLLQPLPFMILNTSEGHLFH